MRRLPPLHALRAFEAAARHLHFARAAEELHLTPTAISHQVRQLEDLLAVQLFQRRPRPLRLTAAGQILFPVLRESLDQMAAAILQLGTESVVSPLRLSMTVAFASRWLMPRLPKLRQQTGLSLAISADERVVDLNAATIDMAIRYAEQSSAGAEWQHLFADCIIAVCSPQLLKSGQILSPEEVLALPLLQYGWKTRSSIAPTRQKWQRAAQAPGQVPQISQTFSEEVHALEAAIAGQGAVLASKFLIGDQLQAGTLVELSDIALPGANYWAVYLANNPARAQLEQLLDWFRQQK